MGVLIAFPLASSYNYFATTVVHRAWGLKRATLFWTITLCFVVDFSGFVTVPVRKGSFC